MQALILQSMHKRLQDMFLSDHVFKCLGAPFSGEYLIAHDVRQLRLKTGSTLARTAPQKKPEGKPRNSRIKSRIQMRKLL
jgi:hypothetical protein